jgi:hypothetical protein
MSGHRLAASLRPEVAGQKPKGIALTRQLSLTAKLLLAPQGHTITYVGLNQQPVQPDSTVFSLNKPRPRVKSWASQILKVGLRQAQV